MKFCLALLCLVAQGLGARLRAAAPPQDFNLTNQTFGAEPVREVIDLNATTTVAPGDGHDGTIVPFGDPLPPSKTKRQAIAAAEKAKLDALPGNASNLTTNANKTGTDYSLETSVEVLNKVVITSKATDHCLCSAGEFFDHATSKCLKQREWGEGCGKWESHSNNNVCQQGLTCRQLKGAADGLHHEEPAICVSCKKEENCTVPKGLACLRAYALTGQACVTVKVVAPVRATVTSTQTATATASATKAVATQGMSIAEETVIENVTGSGIRSAQAEAEGQASEEAEAVATVEAHAKATYLKKAQPKYKATHHLEVEDGKSGMLLDGDVDGDADSFSTKVDVDISKAATRHVTRRASAIAKSSGESVVNADAETSGKATVSKQAITNITLHYTVTVNKSGTASRLVTVQLSGAAQAKSCISAEQAKLLDPTMTLIGHRQAKELADLAAKKAYEMALEAATKEAKAKGASGANSEAVRISQEQAQDAARVAAGFVAKDAAEQDAEENALKAAEDRVKEEAHVDASNAARESASLAAKAAATKVAREIAESSAQDEAGKLAKEKALVNADHEAKAMAIAKAHEAALEEAKKLAAEAAAHGAQQAADDYAREEADLISTAVAVDMNDNPNATAEAEPDAHAPTPDAHAAPSAAHH